MVSQLLSIQVIGKNNDESFVSGERSIRRVGEEDESFCVSSKPFYNEYYGHLDIASKTATMPLENKPLLEA